MIDHNYAPSLGPLGDAAVHYAECGMRVIPLYGIVDGRCTCGRLYCPEPGEHIHRVLAPNGLADASSDPIVVYFWWTYDPTANIGVATGRGVATELWS